MATKIYISVIIPSYNSESSLSSCLDALANQKTSISYEIIVVDSSSHNLARDICERYKKVVFIKRNKKTNPGIGRNIGAEVSRGDILVFIDSDVILDKNAIDNIQNCDKEENKVFGGALELHGDYRLKLGSIIEHYFFNHESQKNRKACIRKNLSSALLIFNKSLFIGIGGFKDIPRMQDTELTERVRSEGVVLSLQPSVVGHQVQDSNLIQVFKKIYINGRNLYPIRYKSRNFNFKLFLVIFLPLISILKASRIIARNVIYLDFLGKLSIIILSPLIYLGCFFWMVGFYTSLLFNKNITDDR